MQFTGGLQFFPDQGLFYAWRRILKRAETGWGLQFPPAFIIISNKSILQMSFKVPFLLGLLVIHLKHPLWHPLLKDIFTPEFLRNAHAFFAKPDELVTEFPAEVWVAAKFSVVVDPVAVILPDAVLGGEEQISDSISVVTGEYLESWHPLICQDCSSCKIKTIWL